MKVIDNAPSFERTHDMELVGPVPDQPSKVKTMSNEVENTYMVMYTVGSFSVHSRATLRDSGMGFFLHIKCA